MRRVASATSRSSSGPVPRSSGYWPRWPRASPRSPALSGTKRRSHARSARRRERLLEPPGDRARRIRLVRAEGTGANSPRERLVQHRQRLDETLRRRAVFCVTAERARSLGPPTRRAAPPMPIRGGELLGEEFHLCAKPPPLL